MSNLWKTSSAFARLVPPAPSAPPNSDRVIPPILSASRCENKWFSATDRLVGADVPGSADEWACAASSAVIVAGDSRESPLGAETGAELSGTELLARSKGLVGLWRRPIA